MADEIHIGNIIKQVFDKRGCTVSWLARQLSCDRSNVYDIFKRESIDTKRLMQICRVLEHDFFERLSERYNEGKMN